MHKSGTTLIARTLHLSGINMGDFDDAVSYDKGNKYEREDTLRFNMDMLGCKLSDLSQSVVQIADPQSILNHQIINSMKQFIITTDSKYTNWGFKDPRSCLTYSIWKAIIPDHRLIAVFRHPLELWHHYRPKHFRDKKVSLYICFNALKAWYVYNFEILKYLRASNDSTIVLDYGDFMASEMPLQNLNRFTGISLLDCRKPELYRNSMQKNAVYRVIGWLHRRLFSRDLHALYDELKLYSTSSIMSEG